MTDIEFAPLPDFVDPALVIQSAASRLRPAHRMTVSEAAEKYRRLRNPGGGFTGRWSNDLVPYMVEPMDAITSRRHEAVVFAGPAQTGKTAALLENGIVYSVAVDPADVLVLQMSQDMARDFSMRRITRMNAETPVLHERMVAGRSDNVFDKTYRGMMLSIGWPSVKQLSSRSIPRVFITDYDRIAQDLGNEGSVFELATKRSQTFGSRGVTVVESSPGRPIVDPKWKRQAGSHAAPPTTGILSLFNRGDRRLWHWKCPHCGEWFEPRFDLLSWPDGATPDEASAETVMICPAAGCVIEPKEKPALNRAGRWVGEAGRERSAIVSFWLKGPAAAFQSWGQIVAKYLRAQIDFDATGSETALQATVNTDQGEAYLPEAAKGESTIAADDLVERVEPYRLARAGAGIRFLTASADVQANRFDCLVRGWGEDLESWVVDRFTLWQAPEASRPLDPAKYSEDWRILIDQALDRTYATPTGGQMRIARLAVDSGGAAGVTANAYTFWRGLNANHRRRVILVKGSSTSTAPRLAMSFPDSKRKDRKAKARGEIPVWFFNPDLLKDELQAQLGRDEVGARYVHLSQELLDENAPHEFFEQLTAETRTAAGKWIKNRPRNEALDLMVMSHAAALSLKAERIDWTRPPGWIEAQIAGGAVQPEEVSEQETADPPVIDKTAGRPAIIRRPRRAGFVKGWK